MQKKINQNTTLSSNSNFFVRIYQQIHRITEHMLKKIKTKIDKKKKSYLVWVVTRFKVGCERGRWLPDWFPRSRVGLWRFGVPVWCVSYDSRSGVREGCGWLASLKMKMAWERDVAGCGWRWINLISLQICEWKCELWGLRERLRSKEKNGWSLDARVKNKNMFFLYL
jgi:hypothetical protein